MSIAMRLSERTPSALRRSNPALKLEYFAIPLGEGDHRPTAVWTFFIDFITRMMW
jgi:hypothetical protein